MQKYFYDLHIHSCLSPCGDEDMTVNNIAGMACIAGLNVLALTDHNTTKNLPAFFKACQKYGIVALGGFELTTAEDIHMVCLFPTLECACAAGEKLEQRRIKIKNKPEIFGRQLILDENDNIIAEEENLLINATTISLEEGYELVKEFSGVAYPAHIDRDANGIIAMLGTIPVTPQFSAFEVYDKTQVERLKAEYPILKDKKLIFCSDAHYLDKIPDAQNFFVFEKGLTDDQIRQKIIDYLK